MMWDTCFGYFSGREGKLFLDSLETGFMKARGIQHRKCDKKGVSGNDKKGCVAEAISVAKAAITKGINSSGAKTRVENAFAKEKEQRQQGKQNKKETTK